MPPRLSAVIIVHNEERTLGACLDSLQGLADEVVVLDDGSTDGTVGLARSRGARVEYRAFDDFGHQKQAALERATGGWILSIDADERVTPQLRRAIETAVAAPGDRAGFWLRRQEVYLGQRLRFGGAGREPILRLARRDRARFALLPVHEHLIVDGPTGHLDGALEHVKYRALSEHLRTLDRYTELAAARKRAQGRRFHGWHVLRIPWELFSRLVLHLGLLDGRAGIVHASMGAFYAFLQYAKLWGEDG